MPDLALLFEIHLNGIIQAKRFIRCTDPGGNQPLIRAPAVEPTDTNRDRICRNKLHPQHW